MNGRKANKRREVSVESAAAIVRNHEESGTCPNCGAEVDTFVSLFEPGAEGVQFGCPECSPAAAMASQVSKGVREAQHRRN